MIDIKTGQYIYKPHGTQYRIYQCDCIDGTFSSYTPVQSEPLFNDPELARKRVYELNGWTYKTKEIVKDPPKQNATTATFNQRHNYYTKKGKVAAMTAFKNTMYLSGIKDKDYNTAIENYSIELDQQFSKIPRF